MITIKKSTALLLSFLMLVLSACSGGNIVKDYREADAGSYIEFGAYEQDNNESNGKEPITWLVLEKGNDKLLIISRDNLAYRQYHSESEAYTVWENCDLREWLNADFLQDAFSADEQGAIMTTTVEVDTSSHGDEIQGNNTQDKVFILSANDAERYFPADKDRIAQNTKSVKKYLSENFFGPGDDEEHCWWLRTRAKGIKFGDGSLLIASAFVDNDGRINDASTFFVETSGSQKNYYGVRPALWLDLTSFASGGKTK